MYTVPKFHIYNATKKGVQLNDKRTVYLVHQCEATTCTLIFPTILLCEQLPFDTREEDQSVQNQQPKQMQGY